MTVEEVGMRKRSRRVAQDRQPQRTCVVCRSTTAKRALHRIVRSPSGAVGYDPTGKAPGRGAYLCGQPTCLETALRRRSIQRALKATDTAAVGGAVEALRNALGSEAAAPRRRSSDHEEVRSG
ncbi:MAG TPA: YlxR family protein [Actinomycetota bacterium]|nr:YlxR family protein [Actinomycetota bacterium]